ncbi:MAG: hypothetical protein N2C14_05915 [Planctomycetales bacterium]
MQGVVFAPEFLDAQEQPRRDFSARDALFQYDLLTAFALAPPLSPRSAGVPG